MEIVKQGKIEYEISIIVPEAAPEIQQYSKDLWLKILRYNIPESKEVFFNGKFSRTNSTDTDYGYKSRNFVLKRAGVKKYQYGKEFPYFNFYLDYKEIQSSSDEYVPPRIELLDNYQEIIGYRCRQAKIETANTTFIIYFTDAFKVEDPTNAVLQHKGIDGFILQQDEIPIAKNVYYYQRYTVKNFDFKTVLPSSVFQIPETFKHFNDIDEVRKINREMMEEDTQRYWKEQPLSDTQKNIFNGCWALDGEFDKIVVEIEYAGSKQQWENKYSFITRNSLNNPEPPQPAIEQAHLWKNFLLVEEPPNYRLYAYKAAQDTMTLEGNNTFTFKRMTKE